jgi:uncharacterized protein (DUF488 family)
MTSEFEILTVGHSTHSAEHFLSLLRRHDVRQLADIRTIPSSRRHPQYNAATLDAFLHRHAISYRHFPALGGLRKPLPVSVNTAWRHAGFRGYADHMQTAMFARGVDELLEFAGHAPTAVMCAEAIWWQCHRQLLSDALLARNVPVRHILSNGPAKPHQLSDFAKVVGGSITYPGVV